ncbi:MAG: hypothetical protein IJ808_00245, partial [Muribaculaceae bacterium]|nr:hypothetical protein [Muribaculaceae bacterium]
MNYYSTKLPRIGVLCAWLLLLLAPLRSQAAHQEMAAYTYDQYKQFTYSWTDADGVTHPNVPITEKATEPRQIIALLREIYTNPNIPGILYGGYAQNNDTRQGLAFYKGVYTGSHVTTTAWNIADADVKSPTTEGYTVLIVAEKDTYTGGNDAGSAGRKAMSSISSYDDLVSYISSSIRSVELLCNGTRVGKAENKNRGTMYSLSGTYNRFFFLSKGRALGSKLTISGTTYGTDKTNETYLVAPFGRMFEQFSPVSASGQNTLSDYYELLKSGKTQDIKHDCPSVIEYQHYFSMSGKTGTESYELSPLCFYIPDYRLQGHASRDVTNSIKDRSSTFIYGITLGADAEQTEPESDHKWKVTLTWESSYNQINLEESQTYYIYRVVDGEVQPEPIATVQSSTKAGNVWTETIDQLYTSQTFTYVVRGKPDAASFDLATSNEQTVGIPGYDKHERLKLTINGDYESTYDYQNEQNKYANYIVLNNGVGTSVITSDYLAADGTERAPTTIELHRYTQG